MTITVISCGIALAGGGPQSQPKYQVATEARSSGQNAPSTVPLPGSPRAESLRVRSLPREILLGQKTFWTGPTRLRVKDLRWALPLTGVTAGLIATDSRLETHLPESPGFVDGTRKFSTAGVAALGGTAGGLYLWGRFGGDGQKREAGLLSVEAIAGSVIIIEVGKFAAGRQRPLEGDARGSFWHAGRSFPSGHAAIAWSTATVLTHEYPGRIPKILGYGLASGVTLTRVTGRRHFPSDVFIGSLIGWYMGQQVFHRHHAEAAERDRFGTFYRDERALQQKSARMTSRCASVRVAAVPEPIESPYHIAKRVDLPAPAVN